MFIMSIIMVTSLFTYRSLVQAVIMIYTSYIILTYKNIVKKYIFKRINSFRPVLTHYSKNLDEGYEEDVEDKDIPMKNDEISNNPFDHTSDSVKDD
jgi:hypothetical protein